MNTPPPVLTVAALFNCSAPRMVTMRRERLTTLWKLTVIVFIRMNRK